MTDEDIAAMREDAEEMGKILSGHYTIPREGVASLALEYAERCVEQVPLVLAEVERLRAREAALVEITRAVASIRVAGDRFDPALPYDARISAWTIHQARALLGLNS